MGKGFTWFRNLLGLKKSDQSSPQSTFSASKPPMKERRRWSFVKSHREKDPHNKQQLHQHRCSSTITRTGDTKTCGIGVHGHDSSELERHNKTAIVVPGPSVAAPEGAVAASQSSASAVSLTSIGSCGGALPEKLAHDSRTFAVQPELAAVKIQAVFRGCLARRALRALKGLVRLQALVRGHIQRKQTAEWLNKMQAIIRLQTRAREGRGQSSESSYSSTKSCHTQHPAPATPEKSEHTVRSRSIKYDQSPMLKRNVSKCNARVRGSHDKLWGRDDVGFDENSWDQLKTSTRVYDTIVEMDSGHNMTRKGTSLFQSNPISMVSDQSSRSFTTSKDAISQQSGPTPSPCEVQSFSPFKLRDEDDESPFCTAENSPRFFSSSSIGGSYSKGPFTPTKSDGCRRYGIGYSDYPSYMCYTESSKAKVRCLSAPKQRPQYERSSSSKGYSTHGLGESRLTWQKALQSSFTGKAYPGSGRLDKLGMPLGHRFF